MVVKARMCVEMLAEEKVLDQRLQNRTLDLLLFSCFLILKNTDIYAYSAYIIDGIVLRVTAEMFMGESAL